MINTVPDILARIVRRKRQELADATVPMEELEARAELACYLRRDFRGALARNAPAVIAEVKKASPSKGVLVKDFDPAGIAGAYERGGAAALSVLTDADYFQGSLGDLMAARAAVSLPVLRKDFTLTGYHVVEAAAHGADAILLIAAVLSVEELRRLRLLAAEYAMAALVEVHDERELEAALSAGADLVGVNNRDLRTFETNLYTSLALAAKMPADVIKVSESGIHSSADIQRLQEAGFQGFLIGEHLMKSNDPAAALQALRRWS